jgi:hypothetical protein
VKRAALIGTHAASNVVHRAIMDFSQRDFKKFETREEALDWLTSEEESAKA